MVCKKCGKELPEGTKFCVSCGAPCEEAAAPQTAAPQAEAAPAASAAPETSAASAGSATPETSAASAGSATPETSAAPEASAVPAKQKPALNNKRIGIIAVAAIAVVLLIVICSLAGRSSYKDPLKDLQKLINKQSTDIFAYQKMISDPMSVKFTKTVYNIVKSNDEIKDNFKDQQEDLKDFYEDIKGFKITKIEIKKADKMKGSELRSIQKNYDMDIYESFLERLDDMDSDDIEDLAEDSDISKGQAKKLVKAMKDYFKSLGKAKVQAGYNLEVIVRAKYDGDTDKTERIDVQVLKINGKWYISNARSFFNDIRFNKDLEDVSLYRLYNKIGYDLSGSFGF